METSTVVPGGDLAGRCAEYRRGYLRGVWDAGPAAPVAMALTCAAWFFGAWCAERADRAEAQLAEMRARGFTGPSARDGDVVMLRWDNGGWRPVSVTTDITTTTTPHVEVR